MLVSLTFLEVLLLVLTLLYFGMVICVLLPHLVTSVAYPESDGVASSFIDYSYLWEEPDETSKASTYKCYDHINYRKTSYFNPTYKSGEFLTSTEKVPKHKRKVFKNKQKVNLEEEEEL
ncbi:gp27 [Listeria phage A511]|uniref:Gp27 n=1 Tax=Listeria phage A511 TaxID=2908169 RepID=A8AT51_BPA51|nr:gp27 [Listeria phage A511]AAY52998.1 gp27 [Listeria phage A511]